MIKDHLSAALDPTRSVAVGVAQRPAVDGEVLEMDDRAGSGLDDSAVVVERCRVDRERRAVRRSDGPVVDVHAGAVDEVEGHAGGEVGVNEAV